jgi:torulene dioxygenase
VQHWFDGFGQTHRFQILSPTKVLYNSRRSCDELIEHIRRTGSIPSSFTFAQRRDPCQSLWRKFFTTFHRDVTTLRAPSATNVCVTLSQDMPGLPATAADGNRSLYAKTDNTRMQGLDPETLEPVGICNQTSLHPELTGQLSSAHAQRCRVSGDVFNYNLELGRLTRYRVFRTCAATGTTEVLATITDAPAAYIHSFFLTENYVVLCVFSAHFGLGGLKILYHKNMLDALEDVAPHKKSHWYVIPRAGGGVARKFEGRPFFAFHSANAWEENGGIVAEVPAFDSIDVIKKFYLNNLKGDSLEARKWADKGKPSYTRFWLPQLAAQGTGVVETLWERPGDVSMELPTINPLYKTKPHRYVTELVFAEWN